MSDKKLTRPHAHPLAMFLRRLLCGVLSAAWVVTASASQEPPVKSDQRILIELEQRWHEAFYQKDVALIEGILADEFVATYGRWQPGRQGKGAGADRRVRSAGDVSHSGCVRGTGLRGHGGGVVRAPLGR